MLVSVNIDSQLAEGHSGAIRSIADAIANSKKIVCITGAGISVSAGIPDFRSADGLYSRVLTTVEGPLCKTIRGKDFFDASFFSTLATRPIFYKFLAELREMCVAGEPTTTHQFLKELYDQGKLLRWYSQNIDGLEKKLGLTVSTDFELSRGKRPTVVALHGTMERLICTLCKTAIPYTDKTQVLLLQGEAPACQKCTMFSADRVAAGRRAVKGGVMRPDIVLYSEPHPHGEQIADFLFQDMARRPTILMVIGTSLKVVGLKKMVKDLARTIRQDNGLVLFINKTCAPRSEWKTIFDYELVGECDKWIELLRPAICSMAKRPVPPPLSPVVSVRIGASSINATPPRKDTRIDQFMRVSRTPNVASVIKKLAGNPLPTEEPKVGNSLSLENSPCNTSNLVINTPVRKKPVRAAAIASRQKTALV